MTQKTKIDGDVRLRFLRLDNDCRASPRDLWPKIEAEIEPLLRGFYEHLSGFSNLAALIGAFDGTAQQVMASFTGTMNRLESASGSVTTMADETSTRSNTVVSAADQVNASFQTVASATRDATDTTAAAVSEVSQETGRLEAEIQQFFAGMRAL